MSLNRELGSLFSTTVKAFQYRDTTLRESEARDAREEQERQVMLAEQELANRLDLARAEAAASMENRLRHEYEMRSRQESERVSALIEAFDKEKKDYFARVEAEVVQLALSIAAKILHREAQVDPALVAALVHIAVGQLRDGSTVSLRVPPEQAPRWRQHMAAVAQKLSFSVVEDAELKPEDCVLETEIGSANFSIAAQLKEVEQGFFDVLAQRPPAR